MTELGNRLKEAREAKGLSVDDLQEITKIQKRYLVGIEEGNYEMMPGKFYVRAFIKQYCEAVGLDSEEIFEEYKSSVPTSIHDELPVQLSRVKSRKNISTSHSKTTDILPKILGAVVVIGVAILVYVLVTNVMSNSKGTNNTKDTQSEKIGFNESKQFTQEKKTNDTTTTKNNEAKVNKKTENPSAKKDTKGTQALTVVSSSGKNSTYELKNTNAFKLKLVSTGKPWVGVTNGSGKYLYQGTLTTSQPQELDLKDESSVIINLGRAQEVEIYVNNQKLEYAISPTAVTTQKVTIQFTKAK